MTTMPPDRDGPVAPGLRVLARSIRVTPLDSDGYPIPGSSVPFQSTGPRHAVGPQHCRLAVSGPVGEGIGEP